MSSVSRQIEYSLKKKPYILEAMRLGIANISSIARILMEELSIKSFQTAMAATRRFSENLKPSTERMSTISKLLSESKLIMRSNIADVTIKNFIGFESQISKLLENFSSNDILYYIKGETVITLIVDEANIKIVKELFGNNIDRLRNNLVQVSIISSSEIETTPGWVGYLGSVLALHDINIVEMVSTYTDTIFIVKQEDANEVYSVFNSLIN